MQSDRIGLKDYFLQHGRRHTYRKGQILLRPGSEPQGVYYDESGLVKVYSLSHDGSEHDHQADLPCSTQVFSGFHKIVPY